MQVVLENIRRCRIHLEFGSIMLLKTFWTRNLISKPGGKSFVILGLRAVKTQNHMCSVFWIVNFVMEYLVLICRSLQIWYIVDFG